MSVKRDIRSIEQRIQAVATRPRVTPQGTVFPRSDYIYTVVPTSLKYMLDADGTVIEESDSGGDAAVLYVYEADAYYKRASQGPFDDTQDPDKPIFTKDSVDGVYKAAVAIRLVSPVLLAMHKEVLSVNRGAYFEVISVLGKPLTPWTLLPMDASVPFDTFGTYRIYIPDGSLILYLISARHESSPTHRVSEAGTTHVVTHVSEPDHIIGIGRGEVVIDPRLTPLGGEWYAVKLGIGDVYVAIKGGVVKITNDPPKYGSLIASISTEYGNIAQIASSTITLLIEKDSPDAPPPKDPDPPPCGHPGNEPYDPEEPEHPFDGQSEEHPPEGGTPDHPGDSPSPPSSGECE